MREEKDTKLADRGWQSMQQMLDREMPAERKRRPVAWWWFGLLLLPMMIWGGQIWWNSTSSDQPTLPVPTAKQDRPVVKTNTGYAEPATMANRPGDAMQKEIPVASNLNSRSGAAGRSSRNPSQPSHIPSEKTVQQLHPVTAQTLDFNQDVEAGNLSAVPRHPPTPEVENPLALQTAFALALPFEAAERKQEPSFNTPSISVIKPVGKATSPKNEVLPRWSFGLATSASTERFTSLNGLSGGAVADLRLSRKWGLRGGLQYTRFLPSPGKQPVVAVEEVSYSNATGLFTGSYGQDQTNIGTGSATESSTQEYVYVPLRKLHQIEMPVLAWWEPLRKTRLYSGVALDYTFLGQSTTENYINNQPVALSSNASRKSASRIATEELPPLQLHYQGGLGIGLGRHVELSVFWRIRIPGEILQPRYDYAYDPAFNANPSNAPVLNNTSSTTVVPDGGRFILQGVWKF